MKTMASRVKRFFHQLLHRHKGQWKLFIYQLTDDDGDPVVIVKKICRGCGKEVWR